MTLYPLRLVDAWQALTPDLIESNLGALVDGLNAVARMRAYQVPQADVGLTLGINGLRFTSPLTTPWVRIRTADGLERAPVVEADAPTAEILGVVRAAPAVADVALVEDQPAASVTALVTALNALLAGLAAGGTMVYINQARPWSVARGDVSAVSLETVTAVLLGGTTGADGSALNLEVVP